MRGMRLGVVAVGGLCLAFSLGLDAPGESRADDADFWTDFDLESARLRDTASLFQVSNWSGSLFTLSNDFPTTAPPAEQGPWLAIDFTTNPADYLNAVLAYVVEGNEEVEWVVQNNAVRKWYHAPWMNFDPKGREPIRGLTSERGAASTSSGPTRRRRHTTGPSGSTTRRAAMPSARYGTRLVVPPRRTLRSPWARSPPSSSSLTRTPSRCRFSIARRRSSGAQPSPAATPA